MDKNVLIPLTLLGRIRELLAYWDISKYDRAVRDDYHCIMRELDVKMQKLHLREAYAKIIQAKDGDAKLAARLEYLWQKNQIGGVCMDDTDP